MSKRPRKSLFSIKDSLKEDEENNQKTEIEEEDVPTDDFENVTVIQFWDDYLSEIKDRKNLPLYSSLKTVKVEVEDKNLVLEFNSISIQGEFEGIKEDFMQRLRVLLNNFKVDTVFKLNEQNVQNYTLSKKEEFEKLVKINPVLDILRRKFDLDIENEPD